MDHGPTIIYGSYEPPTQSWSHTEMDLGPNQRPCDLWAMGLHHKEFMSAMLFPWPGEASRGSPSHGVWSENRLPSGSPADMSCRQWLHEALQSLICQGYTLLAWQWLRTVKHGYQISQALPEKMLWQFSSSRWASTGKDSWCPTSDQTCSVHSYIVWACLVRTFNRLPYTYLWAYQHTCSIHACIRT